MARNRKWFALAAAVLMVASIAAGCSKSGGDTKNNTTTPTPTQTADPNKPVDGGTLTIGTFSDIVNVNPIFIDDTTSQDVANFLFASLYDYNSKGEIVVSPWSIAKEPYKLSDDKKTYTATIRSDAKWSDGTPITVDDVVFTYKTLSNEAVGSPGYSAYAQIADVKAVDKEHVAITLKDVDSRFETSLTAQIVPAKAFEGVKPEDMSKSKFGTDLKATITSGPYTWAEWQEKQYHKLQKNANYWGQKPHIDTIVYKVYADQNTEVQALLKGEVDFLETVPVAQLDALKAAAGIHIYEAAGPVYDYVAFNFKADNWPDGFVPFAGAKTRQAINHAINRQGMVDSVLKGHGSLLNGPFLPGSWPDSPADTAKWEYDKALAEKLLAEDGWKKGADGILAKDGHKFEFEIMTNAGNKRRESYAAIIQQNLQEVGIKVNIKAIDFSALIEQNVTPGKFQALLLGWQLGLDPDAESIFSSQFFPPAGQNSGFYKNEKTDKLWVDGYRVSDKNQRKEIYKGILKEFANDPPYVFLATQNLMTAYNDRVKWAKEDAPVQAVPYGYMYHINNWWVTK